MAIDQATQDKYNALALEIDQLQKQQTGAFFGKGSPSDTVSNNEKISAQIETLKSQMTALEPQDVPGKPSLLDKFGSTMLHGLEYPYVNAPQDPEQQLKDLLNNGTSQTDPKVLALISQVKEKSDVQNKQNQLDTIKKSASDYITKQNTISQNATNLKNQINEKQDQIKKLQTENIILGVKGQPTTANDKTISELQKEITTLQTPAVPIDPKTGKPVVKDNTTTPVDTSGTITIDGKNGLSISNEVQTIVKNQALSDKYYKDLINSGGMKTSDDRNKLFATKLFNAFTDAANKQMDWHDYVPAQEANNTNKIGQLTVPAQETQQTYGTTEYLTKWASDNGIQIPPSQLTEFSKNVLSGNTTIDAITNDLMKNIVATTYPAYKDMLYSPAAGHNGTPGMSGMTIRQLASPYTDLIGKVFGVDAATIPMNDSRLEKMMQYVDPKTGKPAVMPKYQAYADVIQKDPGWGKTQDAWNNLGAKFDPILGDIGGAPAEFRNQNYESGL